MKILVTGATGFVGREVLRQLGTAQHHVVALARNPDQASARLGDISCPVVVRAGNVLHAESLRGRMDGCDAILHLVGIISEFGEQTFENVHVRATENVLAEANRAGIRRWIHMSALGTRPGAASRYHQTKWAAEEAVRESGLDWTIFRPSLIYGPEDHLTNLFARIARWSPVLPVMGNGQNLVQPVAVEEVACCFARALTTPGSIRRTFDVCGLEAMAFAKMLDYILAAQRKRRLKLHVPLAVARGQAWLFERIFPVLLRQSPPLNRDQLLMLQEDNIGDGSAATTLFKLKLRPFAEGLSRYLQPAAQTSIP